MMFRLLEELKIYVISLYLPGSSHAWFANSSMSRKRRWHVSHSKSVALFCALVAMLNSDCTTSRTWTERTVREQCIFELLWLCTCAGCSEQSMERNPGVIFLVYFIVFNLNKLNKLGSLNKRPLTQSFVIFHWKLIWTHWNIFVSCTRFG